MRTLFERNMCRGKTTLVYLLWRGYEEMPIFAPTVGYDFKLLQQANGPNIGVRFIYSQFFFSFMIFLARSCIGQAFVMCCSRKIWT